MRVVPALHVVPDDERRLADDRFGCERLKTTPVDRNARAGRAPTFGSLPLIMIVCGPRITMPASRDHRWKSA